MIPKIFNQELAKVNSYQESVLAFWRRMNLFLMQFLCGEDVFYEQCK